MPIKSNIQADTSCPTALGVGDPCRDTGSMHKSGAISTTMKRLGVGRNESHGDHEVVENDPACHQTDFIFPLLASRRIFV